jgi:hypothetical protein
MTGPTDVSSTVVFAIYVSPTATGPTDVSLVITSPTVVSAIDVIRESFVRLMLIR